MRRTHLGCFLVCFLVLTHSAKATTYYVNNCGSDTCNGQYAACWTQGVSNCAKKTIKAGMNIPAVVAGDTILVAAGEYTDTNPADKNNRDLEFPRTNGVARAITVKCEAAGQCTINCDGSSAVGDDHRGFFFNDDHATNLSVVDGFRIINGFVDNGNPSGGGAIAGKLSAPTIKNCIIENNTGNNGGGVYLFYLISGTGPQISNTVFAYNEVISGTYEGRGGGLYADSLVGLAVRNCTFAYNKYTGTNSAFSGGGGIAFSNVNGTIANTHAWGNQATGGNSGSQLFLEG